MRLSYVSCLLALIVFYSTPSVYAQNVTSCPAKHLEISKVEFTAKDCITSSWDDYKMLSRSEWLLITYPNGDIISNQDKPSGLFISGYMSSKVFVNGVKIGENGLTALQLKNEVSGDFDWVGFVPESVLKPDNNQIVMHISSFHASGSNPFNRFYFDTYEPATQKLLMHYWPTFIPLGAMLLSLIYLLRRLLLEPKKRLLLFLLGLTLAGILQLSAEVYRGLVIYKYPIHDIRLGMIAFFAFVFGQALFAQTLIQFAKINIKIAFVFCGAIVALSQLYISDMDFRATTAIQIPAVLAALLIAFSRSKDKQLTYTPAAILLAFAILIAIAPANFLDIYLYYCMAAMSAYLFSNEARYRVNRQKELATEKQRAEKLQLALDIKADDNKSLAIALKDMGRVTMVSVENVLYCKGAGDYVEVILKHKTILYSGSLSNIANDLPSYFLKVHRSYLVNVKHIALMRRLPTGTGEIELSTGHVIPVSRRLLPTLKETLTG